MMFERNDFDILAIAELSARRAGHVLEADALALVRDKMQRCAENQLPAAVSDPGAGEALPTMGWFEVRVYNLSGDSEIKRELLAAISRLHEAALRSQQQEGGTPNVLQGFVAFIGKGENARGYFPANLTELNDDAIEFAYGGGMDHMDYGKDDPPLRPQGTGGKSD